MGTIVSDLPDRIARYRIRSVLGVGGFGIVVSALDEALDALVAVKVLSAEHNRDPQIRERFVREAKLLRRVRSSHVIAVHDLGDLDDGRPYLVMELADGGVLADRIDGKPVDAAGVRAAVTALAGGLGALHAVGVIHRDVTPGNLLVVDDSVRPGDRAATVQRAGLLADGERIVVADLGLAKDQERTAAGPTILGGTPHFRSPEQTRRGEIIGPEADVYGATGVLWNLLTGEPPGGEGAIDAQLATVPGPWRHVLGRGLAFEASARFSTMTEWEAAALEAIEQDSGLRDIGFRSAVAGATCPYKGLTSFQPEDAAFFFGREALVDELVARLQSSSTLVIGGPSGSGKSSLLRAGLVPAISNGALAGSQHWPVVLFSPGADPLSELAHQLGRLDPDGPEPTPEQLRADPAAVRAWLRPGITGLIAIDQFEEVFTQATDERDCHALLDVLDALTQWQDAHLRVVMALRSDFYSTCARHPWLARRISDNQVLVGPMGRGELRRSIEGPAQRAGLRLEAGLTEAILDEAGEEAGGLPLIAHALMETWIRRRGTVLTLDGFQAAGGVAGAIAQSAEQAYERLAEHQRVAARRLFLRLVNPGDDAPDTRRRVSWVDLGVDAAARDVVDELASARLLTVDDRGVELVHETLIRSWPRLRRWIDESREDLRLQQRIAWAAAEWVAEDRDPDLLYRGAPLAAVIEWRQRGTFELPATTATFLDASDAARDAEERAASAQDLRRRRVRRIAFAALAALTLAAFAASIVAVVALRQSQHNEAEAEQRFARGLATQAESLASTRPKLALALAAESAARLDPIPPEAQRAMVTARIALAASDIVSSSEPIPVGDVLTTLVTPDGSTIITGARGGTVELRDVATGEVTATLSGPSGGIEEAAIDPGGRWLVAVGPDGLWRWDLRSDRRRGDLIDRPQGALWSVAFSGDGQRLATAAEDGVVRIYATSSWKPTGSPLTADVDFLSVAFTVDGKRLLAGTGDGRVFMWDVAQRSLIGAPIAAHGTNDVWELVVDPQGGRVATVSSDGTARVWSLGTGDLLATPFVSADGDRSLDAVSGLVWALDGATLYASGDDGRVHEWDIARESEVDSSVIGHDDRVTDAAASADRNLLVTLGRDQNIRIWDITTPTPTSATLGDIHVPLYGVAVSDDRRVAVGDGRGEVHVVSPGGRSDVVLKGLSGRVFGLGFLPNGRLVAGDDSGSLRIWDIDTGRTVITRQNASQGAVTSIAVAPSGDRFATSSADGVVRVWTANELDDPFAETPKSSASVTKVTFGVASGLVASYDDGRVRFWSDDGSETRPPLRVDRDGDVAFGVAVSGDGGTMAVASATDGVTLWDLATGEQRTELNGQPTSPVDVAFTRDGAALVGSTRDGTIMVWNSITGEAISPRFRYHDDAVWRVVVAPRSAIIASSEDGTLSEMDALDVRRACELSAGVLDRRARQHYLGDRDAIGCRR